MVSSHQSEVVVTQDTKMTSAHDDVPISDPPVNPLTPNPDFRPWMLISCRRGRVRDCGTGLRVGHATSDMAATETTSHLCPRSESVGGTCGACRV